MVAGVLAVALFYIVLPNHRVMSDAMIAAVRMRDVQPWFIHPNHLLHPLLPEIILKLGFGRLTGLNELEMLLAWSMMAGTLGAWFLLLSLREGGMPVVTSLIGLGLYAFSSAVWYFSVAAGPSATALAFSEAVLLALVIASRRAPYGLKLPTITWLAVISILSIIASQFNAILMLPACYVVLMGSRSPKTKGFNVFCYLAITIVGSLMMYILGGVIFNQIRSPLQFMDWQHSYVYGSRWWSQGFVDTVQRNWIGAISVPFTSAFYKYGLFGDWALGFGKPIWLIWLVIRASQAFVLLFLLIETIGAIVFWIRTRRILPVQAIGAISSIPIILFSCFWTPETTHYRVMYAPGFILFLTPYLHQRYELGQFRLRKAWPLLLAVLLLFAINLTTQFIPQSNPNNNPYIREVNTVEGYVTPNDLIIYSGTDAGQLRALYTEYFIQCSTLLVQDLYIHYQEDPDDLIQTFNDLHESGGRIYIHEDAIYSEEDVAIMNGLYGLDIQPGEIANLMSAHMRFSAVSFTVNSKHYYIALPMEADESMDQDSEQAE